MNPKMCVERILRLFVMLAVLAALPLGSASARVPEEAPAAAFAPGESSISGRVTAADTGLGLYDAPVYLFDQDANYLGSTRTNVMGDYGFYPLADGAYLVQFDAPTGGSGEDTNYLSKFYDGAFYWFEATPITISDGAAVTGIDAMLERGGMLSGKVTSAVDDSPLENVYVEAGNLEIGYSYGAYTDAQGNYTVYQLPTGTYRVRFSPDNSNSDYLEEYYNDKTLDSADQVLVTAGLETSGIDASLALGGSISGRVTTEDVTPLPVFGLHMIATLPDNSRWYDASVQPDGSYTIHGLPAADYIVQFFDQNGVYLGEYYDNKFSWDTADLVTVAPLQAVTGIDVAIGRASTITGTVTAADTGLGLADAPITVTHVETGNSSSAVSGADGSYTITGLPGGSYRVKFEAPPDSGYLGEYYNNRRLEAEADLVTVAAGATLSGVNAALEPGGVITGVVTAEADGAPINCVGVLVYRDGALITQAVTDQDGRYTVKGLSAGSYVVWFNPEGYCWGLPASIYKAEFYNNKPDMVSADPIQVTEGSTQEINAALAMGPTISGVVRDADSGAPIYDARVTAYSAPYYFTNPIGYADTDVEGRYTIVLPYGATYYLSASAPSICDPVSGACEPSSYARQFYQGKPALVMADGVTVADQAQVTGIDFALEAGGQITGRVTDAESGLPLADARVQVETLAYETIEEVRTDGDGNYTIYGMPSGTYLVKFIPPTIDGIQQHAVEYYNGKRKRADANPVTVVKNQVTSGINAALKVYGGISGRVTAADTGAGLEGVTVSVFDEKGEGVVHVRTDAQGYYRAVPLGDGTYRLRFSTDNYDSLPETTRAYLTEYYNNKPSLDLADPVIVRDDEEGASGINAALALGGKISGRVTAEDTGEPLEGVFVTLNDPARDFSRTTLTNAEGEYSIIGLSGGQYSLQFSTSYSANPTTQGYAGEYYQDQPASSLADPLTIATGQVMTGLDAQLARGGAITGTVTASDTGNKLSSVFVDLYRVVSENQADFLTTTMTDMDGSYRFSGLAAGEYLAEFRPLPGVPYLAERYNNSALPARGDPITVTADHTNSGIDAALEPGVCVTGTVTSAVDGYEVGNVRVSLIDSAGIEQGYGVSSSSHGMYETTAVKPGVYRVYFNADKQEHQRGVKHASEYYDGKATLKEADPVLLELGKSPIIDATLEREQEQDPIFSVFLPFIRR